MREQLPEITKTEKEVTRIFELLGYRVISPSFYGARQTNFLLGRTDSPERFFIE